MSEELKPCPFCGGNPEKLQKKYETTIGCPRCEIENFEYSKELAFKFWNTRPREQQLEQALLEAKSALANFKFVYCEYPETSGESDTVEKMSMPNQWFRDAQSALASISALNLGEKEKEKDGENKSVDEAVRRYENNGE